MNHRGFTLIELVVVMAVIVVMATVALPALFDFGPVVDAGPLEGVRILLLEAKRDAEQTGAEVELAVVPASGRYRRELRRPGDPLVVREGVVSIPGVHPRPSDDRFRVVFRPVGLGLGDTLAAGGVRLYVEGATGRIIIER